MLIKLVIGVATTGGAVRLLFDLLGQCVVERWWQQQLALLEINLPDHAEGKGHRLCRGSPLLLTHNLLRLLKAFAHLVPFTRNGDLDTFAQFGLCERTTSYSHCQHLVEIRWSCNVMRQEKRLSTAKQQVFERRGLIGSRGRLSEVNDPVNAHVDVYQAPIG